ncbi:MAG: type II toxin-antitoxin system RelE/ParE family toxin [Gammaproteobacteria bacterium]|jgi:plasmid stabilization system protein ParE|nr:type II toxin-antitoxin system RelE/ParE family toxin [Gammaproteobacteria bacterium]
MAEIIWTLNAKNDLVGLADYIALNNPKAAAKLVNSVIKRISTLTLFPESGRSAPELPSLPIRELIVPPCRIFYKVADQRVYILHIMREEQQLRLFMLNLK